uniref:signal peptidase II n=1 Tax=uncultured Prochlorococcus sp. TaxID=159733 RepID=UPI00258F3422
MINKVNRRLYFFSLSIFIIFIDQYLKYLIYNNSTIYENKDFLLFKIYFVKNYGAAFNLFSGSRIFLSIISF